MKVITEQKGRVFQADVAFIGLRRSTITNTTKVGLKEMITYEKISTQGPDLVWKFMTSTHILGQSSRWRERLSSWNISLFAAAAAAAVFGAFLPIWTRRKLPQPLVEGGATFHSFFSPRSQKEMMSSSSLFSPSRWGQTRTNRAR